MKIYETLLDYLLIYEFSNCLLFSISFFFVNEEFVVFQYNMSDRLIFITFLLVYVINRRKDNQEVVVSKSLFYEMSGMIRSLFECYFFVRVHLLCR